MHDKIKKFNKRNLILPIAILATAGVISLGAVSTNAYFGGGQRHDDMVKELAVKLGVDETKVSAVFEEMHEEHQQEMESRLSKRLDEADHDEMEAWAEEQGIDLEYFMGPMGGHMGIRGSMMKWDN